MCILPNTERIVPTAKFLPLKLSPGVSALGDCGLLGTPKRAPGRPPYQRLFNYPPPLFPTKDLQGGLVYNRSLMKRPGGPHHPRGGVPPGTLLEAVHELFLNSLPTMRFLDFRKTTFLFFLYLHSRIKLYRKWFLLSLAAYQWLRGSECAYFRTRNE